MYVPPFLCGIITTILAEILVVVGFGIYSYVSSKRRKKDETAEKPH